MRTLATSRYLIEPGVKSRKTAERALSINMLMPLLLNNKVSMASLPPYRNVNINGPVLVAVEKEFVAVSLQNLRHAPKLPF
jgi:hypothetical protein